MQESGLAKTHLEIFSILLLVSFSFGADVYDFAPSEIGNTWQYSYHSQVRFVGTLLSAESLEIEMKIVGKEVITNDTLVFFDISEYGVSVTGDRTTGINDTVFVDTITFTDTAVISSNGIRPIKGDNFRNPEKQAIVVFPFWMSHGVPIEHLNEGIAGSDTVLYFDTGSSGPQDRYLQNVGVLTKKYAWSLGMSYGDNNARLKSFNKKEIPLSMKNTPDYRDPLIDERRQDFLKSDNRRNGVYLISGKKLNGNKSLNGLTIIAGQKNIHTVK